MKKFTKTLGRKKYLAAAIPLIMAANVQSIEFYAGGIEGSFDTQISIGSSWRTEKQDDFLLTPGNTEDGNANFKNGDAFSQVFKASHDLQFSYKNFGGFVRGKYWYDSALKDNNVLYGHGPTATTDSPVSSSNPVGSAATLHGDSRLDDSGFNDLAKFSGATILDAFIYGEFEVANMPLDVRLGKQVVSWGESTFIRGGINAINPVDVSAFYRPGAEIKEALLPVSMAYANIGLTDNLSAEAFYQLEFQQTVMPGCGTYFSTEDYAAQGCNLAVMPIATLDRQEDGIRKPDADGQFGVAFRYLSEALADTEIGVYYMNIHSHTPTASGVKAENFVNGAGLIPGLVGQYMQAGQDQATATANAQAAASYQAMAANSVTTEYFTSYTEDMQVAGLSFATTAGSVALSGEVSHTIDLAMQINASQLLGAALTGLSTNAELMGIVAAADGGEAIDGFRLFDVTQVQMTAMKFIDQFAGASRIILIGEAGYSFIHDLDESAGALRFGRPSIYEGTEDAGYTTQSSYGYSGRIVAQYSDVFAGVNLTPVFSWKHDVKGYGPQAGSGFKEGEQTLGFTLKADYLNMYNASISYTQFMEGDYSVTSDRDYASISLGMQF